MISKIIILIIGVVLAKATYNLYYYLLAKKFLTEYLKYVKKQKDWFIRENRQKIIKVLEKARIEDSDQPNVEPLGYGMVNTRSFSVFKNLAVLRRDIVDIITSDLHEAVSVYKSRILESINPIYWIEYVIFLPKNILTYLGVPSSNLITKIFQIVWWLLGALATIVGVLFNKEFISWLTRLL